MAIEESSSLIHWNYFLALEADIERLARYVEFTSENFNTYSIELAHLLLAISSEVDVVARQLCNYLESSSRCDKIDQYREIIKRHIPNIAEERITIPRYGLTLNPWQNWSNNESPNWWRDHNKVKHLRNEHFKKANLSNVLNAMSGLFLLILYYYRNTIDGKRIEPPPTIFTPEPSLASVSPTAGGRMALFFNEQNN
ncbi:hypothetical protein [Hydrogenimonas sp.]